MKKQTLSVTIAFTAIISLFLLSGCGEDPTVYDETGYLGTYTGYHHLDSAGLISLGVGEPGDFSFLDTIVVTNGSSVNDGKLNGKSSLLSGGTIEISLSNNQITPVKLGNISILGTTIKNTNVNPGSTGIWNSDKSLLATKLNATVTYNFNGTDLDGLPITINGSFSK